MDAVIDTRIQNAHAIDEDVVVANMETPTMDKHLIKHRAKRDLIAKYAQVS